MRRQKQLEGEGPHLVKSGIQNSHWDNSIPCQTVSVWEKRKRDTCMVGCPEIEHLKDKLLSLFPRNINKNKCSFILSLVLSGCPFLSYLSLYLLSLLLFFPL